MPPVKRNLISKYPGSQVTAGTSDNTPVGADPLPNGRTIRITCFGAALTHEGKAELQLRTALPNTWRTLRAVAGPGTDHFENLQPIVGDGSIAALRIRRTNDDASDRRIHAWVEGYRSRG